MKQAPMGTFPRLAILVSRKSRCGSAPPRREEGRSRKQRADYAFDNEGTFADAKQYASYPPLGHAEASISARLQSFTIGEAILCGLRCT